MQGRDPHDTGRALRLSQFLELQSRWLGGADVAELAHRIRQTVGLLMGGVDAEVTLVDTGRAGVARPLAEPVGHPRLATRQMSLERKALAAMSPQLQTEGERAHGAFPFAAGATLRGCLHVTIPRPLFEGSEVVFLRFVASVSGLVLATAPNVTPAPRSAAGNGPPAAEAETDARRYVAMAVHDLRNPLNVISGFGSLLADGTLGTLSPEQAEAVDAINRQVTVLLGHIAQLIDFDRLSRAETSLSPSVVQLRALFDELRERCFASPSSPVFWPGAEAGFEFVTDRRRLFAVVQNLVDNALKHGGAGSIEVACTRRDGRLEISVSDRGPGLPPAVRQALADRDACEHLRDRGAGLGLFTVASYVKALGGRLEARTPEDGRTTLAVSLPSLATPPDRPQT